MNITEKVTLSISFFALALSTLALAVNLYSIAGLKFNFWLLYLSGTIAGISMIVFFIMGAIILFSKKF